MATMTRRGRIKALKRRLDHLERRVDSRNAGDEGSAFDLSEIKSLRWAIGILEPMVEEDDPRTRRGGPERSLLG